MVDDALVSEIKGLMDAGADAFVIIGDPPSELLRTINELIQAKLIKQQTQTLEEKNI